MKKSHCVRNTIERQISLLGVHINPYSVGAGNRDFPGLFIVSKTTLAGRTFQAPGQVVVSQNNSRMTTLSFNPFICDSHIDPLCTWPFHLPVGGSRQTVFSQHLIIWGKSLWKIGVGQGLVTPGHLSVAIRKPQMVVCCVDFQWYWSGIWKRRIAKQSLKNEFASQCYFESRNVAFQATVLMSAQQQGDPSSNLTICKNESSNMKVIHSHFRKSCLIRGSVDITIGCCFAVGIRAVLDVILMS